MTLLHVDRLTKSYGTDLLFESFSAQISRGDRIALIGDNGVGKSTLLHLLRGSEVPSGGEIRPIGDVRIAAAGTSATTRSPTDNPNPWTISRP